MYRIALLTEENLQSSAQFKAQQVSKTLVRNATSAMFQNTKKRNAIAEIAEIALCTSNCALPTSGVL